MRRTSSFSPLIVVTRAESFIERKKDQDLLSWCWGTAQHIPGPVKTISNAFHNPYPCFRVRPTKPKPISLRWSILLKRNRNGESAENLWWGTEASETVATGHKAVLRQVRPRKLRQLQRIRRQRSQSPRRALPPRLQPLPLGPQQGLHLLSFSFKITVYVGIFYDPFGFSC